MVLIKYDKAKLILSNSLYSILNHLDFYKKYNYLNNPFISKLFYAFQDSNSFYLVKKFYPGGDLYYHINRKIFSEEKSKFVAANIILGLEFLHSKGYIYRDLIPQNLVFDKKGYLHINDMTLMREISDINYLVTSGHPGYIAPEIIFRQKYGIESDFFSLGVILYEIMFNRLPFNSKSKEEYINDLASSHNALIKEDELNIGWSRECADFINKCLQKKPELRIGFEGIEELKSHIWIRDFDWRQLRKKEYKAPFIPKGKNNYYIRKKEEKIELFEEKFQNFIEYYETMNYFNGFYYNYYLDENFNKENKEEEDEIIEEEEINENIDEDEEVDKEKELNECENIINTNNNEDDLDKKNKKKRKTINEEKENNDFKENKNKNKKNKRKRKQSDEDELGEINIEKRKNRTESNHIKNYYEEESKGQLMNLNNKKGLLNKIGNKRKSVKNERKSKKMGTLDSKESLNFYYKKKNNNDDY